MKNKTTNDIPSIEQHSSLDHHPNLDQPPIDPDPIPDQQSTPHNTTMIMDSWFEDCANGSLSAQWLTMDETYGNADASFSPNCSSVPISDPSNIYPQTLPREMTFNSDNLVSVISYSVLFMISAIGNLTVFITLFRNRRRHRKTRVNLFIMHLCIADLLVTFIMLPMETAWHVTVGWLAGDAMCRILMFFRTFGFYLGSFILVTISLDRYFAILKPLSLNDADRRGKVMLVFAWLFSVVASVPQSVIFHVESHPQYPQFSQCVTFHFFPTPKHELAYNLFNILTIYFIPLVVIIISYSLILCEISKKTSESKKASTHDGKDAPSAECLRRSGMGRIQRAKIRTLRMTVVIVAVFILCWSPYYIISIWWWIDKSSAGQVDPKVQRALFIFAVSNSCMDPIVYGMFTIDFKGEFYRCCCLLRKKPRDDATYSYSGFSKGRRYRLSDSGSGSIEGTTRQIRFKNADRNGTSGSVSAVSIESTQFAAIRPQRRTKAKPVANGNGGKVNGTGSKSSSEVSRVSMASKSKSRTTITKNSYIAHSVSRKSCL